MKKLLVGMSGGVDSSAAALLLQRQGYDIAGVTLILRDGTDVQKDVSDASAVAKKLGIPHLTPDFREEFENTVIADFRKEYSEGRTPNPCCVCNRFIKFGLMLDYALENGFDGIATGHYAVIKSTENGAALYRSRSNKDQSYFLWALSERQLAHSVFPLDGTEDKEFVRNLCNEAGLPTAHRKDSQEICFIPDDDYVGFLEKSGVSAPEGDFLDTSGNVIGHHSGIIRYTIGQRKGLGAFGRPVFVTDINARSNTVTLGDDGEQYSKGLIADKVNVISGKPLPDEFRAKVKIRFRARPEDALIRTCEEGIEIIFDEPQRSVTPGQAAVICDGDLVVGGGRIIRKITGR